MSKPLPASYPTYFQRYLDQVEEEDLSIAFQNQSSGIKQFLSTIDEAKSTYAYAEDKWTLKEVLQHIIDAERIFNYRALCISRKEKNSLPGFDENEYAANSNGNARKWQDLVDEFLTVRKGTEIMFNSFTGEMLENSGLSNNNPITVKSLGFITLGHFNHHKRIIEERYL